ncbi:hypothetical protein FA13DRAFT_1748072, partial [Coprinellus micaceus]
LYMPTPVPLWESWYMSRTATLPGLWLLEGYAPSAFVTWGGDQMPEDLHHSVPLALVYARLP